MREIVSTERISKARVEHPSQAYGRIYKWYSRSSRRDERKTELTLSSRVNALWYQLCEDYGSRTEAFSQRPGKVCASFSFLIVDIKTLRK
jgi:hypothetical protein